MPDFTVPDLAKFCPTGQTICGGVCVDTQTSLIHCGACGAVCTLGQVCGAGKCRHPVTCKEMLATYPMAKTGLYTIDPDLTAGPVKPLLAYCDMTTVGGSWTLIEAFDIAKRSIYSRAPFATKNMPRNQDAHNWDDYRLDKARILALFAKATRFHARCHRDLGKSPKDWLFGNIVLVQNSYSYYYTNSNGTNPQKVTCMVRGHSCGKYNFRWWNIDGGNSWHPGFDVSITLPGSTYSEDSFTWADGALNNAHLCHVSAGEIVWMVR